MFIKYLQITNDDGLIRRIDFRMGMNLIVDDTQDSTSDTGNNVGKTTLLRLIDFCLGGKADYVYKSTDKTINEEVKQFLEESNVEVELCLVDTFDHEDSRKVVIKRNFLQRNKALRTINGRPIKDRDFDSELQDAIWNVQTTAPSFRQIISHSLRIDDLRLTQPLQTFPTPYGSYVAYENVHLYMFGANVEDADRKVELSKTITDDGNFKRRLEKEGTLSALNAKYALAKHELDKLEKQRETLKLNPDFEQDLDDLALIKNRLNQLGVDYNNLKLRKSLILEAVNEMTTMQSNANSVQVENIYKQAGVYIDKLHHTFKELLRFHNEMLSRKSEFITSEIPQLEQEIYDLNDKITELRKSEVRLQNKLNLSISYDSFDNLITRMNELNHEMGSLEDAIRKIEDVEKSISNNEQLLNKIDQDLFSEEWKRYVQEQLNKFNVHFAEISKTLYDSDYIVKYEIVQSKGKPCYKFQTDAANSYGSGKKQGEITCFDLAYIKFADEENIPCLHFTLYDKMELVHGNQLGIITDLVEGMGGEQCIVAILRDKFPQNKDVTPYIVQELTQEKRLFKMEESTWYLSKHSNVK